MPAVIFTPEELRRLMGQPPDKRAVLYTDIATRGIALEHRRSGTATWYFRYRNAQNRIRMLRIGDVDDWTVDAVREEVLRLRRYVDEGGDPAAERGRPDGGWCLRAFVEQAYVPYIRSRKRSWRAELALLKWHVLPVFGDQPLDAIRRVDVVRWHQSRREAGYAVGTCNRMLVQLRHIFNMAIRWEVMPRDSNPTVGVEAFSGETHRDRYLSQEEVARLFGVLDGYGSAQVADIIRVLLFTGARKREILNARWEHIDFERGILTVPRSKSGKPRYIQLPALAIEALHRQPREEAQPWVFPSPRTGRPYVSIYYSWDTIRRRARLPGVRMHDLRHSFASFLVNAGRSLYEVQMLLGHSSPKTTMRYAHLSSDSLRSAAELATEVMWEPTREDS